MISADKRWTNFFKSETPLVSPRVSFMFSKGINLGDLVRRSKEGEEVSFFVPGLKDFEAGYNFEGLVKSKDMQSFYEEKGIDYVTGIIKRFKDEGRVKCFSRAYSEAVIFKENYSNKK